MSEDTEWSDYNTGPFCRHYSDWTCEEVCVACGHSCYGHDDNDCNDCECTQWIDAESDETLKAKADKAFNGTKA